MPVNPVKAWVENITIPIKIIHGQVLDLWHRQLFNLTVAFKRNLEC